MKKPEDSILSDEIFYGSILKKISAFDVEKPTRQNLAPGLEYGDSTNSYIYNSKGYRSIEFKPVDLMFAGCSLTFGVGVPLEGAWPSIVAKELGQEYVNLSYPGWSARAIVQNLLNYFYKYGNPKTLFVLFPEYIRTVTISRKGFNTFRNPKWDNHEVSIGNIIINKTPVDSRPKYSKQPHPIQDLIAPEYGLMEAISYINILISYCKSAKIELVWSTWAFDFQEILNEAKKSWNKEEYKSYVPMAHELANCHESYLEQYGDNFYIGQDGHGLENYSRHPGVHSHLHYAEIFLSKLAELRNLS